MSNEALKPRVLIQNLAKTFKLYERPQDRLLELIFRTKRHENYQALQDISFAVPDGKSVGIIGSNGAGKSTLLKLIVGTLQPTSGDIEVSGQIAALLELGAGFHPDFTGRKNIYLNASLLGVPAENILQLEREIIEFSELEQFIDRPVKTYSTGMYVRLAFSIATMVRPDILVIDEALSVGDMAFQKKCVTRMNQFRKDAKSMILCSHSMFHIQELCDFTVWIDEGRVKEFGESERVVGHYENFNNNKKSYNSIREDIPDAKTTKAQENSKEIQECRINSLSVYNEENKEVSEIKPLSTLILKMNIEVLVDNIDGHFGFAFMRSAEEPISSFLSTNSENVNLGECKKGDVITVSLLVEKIAMRTGEFFVLGGLADKSGLLWYETKFSSALSMTSTKGVGPLIMDSTWTVEKKTIN
ncbi:ABC transporter ATP-binding protein [Gammaproteobacteria bacterium]|nr:ABC transporter ATP-binding protein [Gammaproteobacteria bacterium]